MSTCNGSSSWLYGYTNVVKPTFALPKSQIPFEGFATYGPSIKKFKDYLKLFSIDLESIYNTDPLPIPDTQYRNFYHGKDHLSWWLSGFIDYVHVKYTLTQLNFDFQNLVYLDMGGSTGRVSRHWKNMEKDSVIYTSDTNRGAIGYICKYLGNGILNTFAPKFSTIPSNHLSLITAYSVFTHMEPNTMINWLYELRRILRPGGVAWITIHGNHTWKRLCYNKEKDNLAPTITDMKYHGSHLNIKTITENQFANTMVFRSRFKWNDETGGDKMKEKEKDDDTAFTNTFISYDSVYKHWNKIMNVVKILPQGSSLPLNKWPGVTPTVDNAGNSFTIGQDVVILQKK